MEWINKKRNTFKQYFTDSLKIWNKDGNIDSLFNRVKKEGKKWGVEWEYYSSFGGCWEIFGKWEAEGIRVTLFICINETHIQKIHWKWKQI